MIFLNSLSASWLVRELSSPWLDWPRVGLSVNCPVSLKTALETSFFTTGKSQDSCDILKDFLSRYVNKDSRLKDKFQGREFT